MRVIAVVDISLVPCHQIVREVNKITSPALFVDFHVESSSVVQILPFPSADGCGAGTGTGVRVTSATVSEGFPN